MVPSAPVKSYPITLLLISLPFLILSCSDSGNNAVPSPEIEHVISPGAVAGSIQQNGDTLEPKANGGYVFAYWVVISATDTTFVQTRELQTSADTTRRVIAHFDGITTINYQYTTSHDGQFVYFISSVQIPVSDDFSPEIEYSYRIFQYDVVTGEKKVVFASDRSPTALHISHNDQFLSFALYVGEKGSDIIHVLNIDERTVQQVAPGRESGWANNSLRLLSGNQQGLYIYNAETFTTEYIAEQAMSDEKNVIPFLIQARWSPDDQNILLGGIRQSVGDDTFLRYSFAKHRIIEQSIDKLGFAAFYAWINSSNFIVVGDKNRGTDLNGVFRSSISSSPAALQLLFETFYAVGISPSKEFLAYSPTPNDSPYGDLRIYNIETGDIQTIAGELFSRHVIWNSDDYFLTRTSGEGLIMVTFPEGEIIQI